MAARMPRRLVALSGSAVATIYLAGLLSTRPAANDIAVDAATEPPSSPESTLTLSNPDATSMPVVIGASTPATATPELSPVPATSTPVALATSTAARIVTTAPAATSTPVGVPTSAPTASSQPAPAATTYASGTYAATGTSRLGDVTVSVSISADRITNVQITKSTTKYPASRIASLPAQVISTQSASVNVVTGATYSSQAFKQAVQQALAQARAAA
jgi:uncharacterized protein with FMN-binding domain